MADVFMLRSSLGFLFFQEARCLWQAGGSKNSLGFETYIWIYRKY